MEVLIILILTVAILALCLYTLIDVIKSEFENSSNKIIWILIILFLGPIGSIIYLSMGKKQKKMKN